MSDSEEEAFRSADEGEEKDKQSAKTNRSKEKNRASRKSQDNSTKLCADATTEKEPGIKVSPEAEPSQPGSGLPDKERSPSTHEETLSETVSAKLNLNETAEASSSERTEAVAKDSERKGGGKRTSDDQTDVRESNVSQPPVVDQPSVQQIPREEISREREVIDRMAEAAEEKGSWSSWSTWGTNVLSTATSSVKTFTSQVGEGMKTVVDTLEAELGIPPAEELARSKPIVCEKVAASNSDSKQGDQETQENLTAAVSDGETSSEKLVGESTADANNTAQDEVSKPEPADGGWMSWGAKGLSNLTSLAQDTSRTLVAGGQTLVSGGIDVLETIGKKTYEVVAEGDHGLKETLRSSRNKTNLSQALREAAETAAEQAGDKESFEEERKAHYGALFELYQGLVQLEALELLSSQSDSRLLALLGSVSDPIKLLPETEAIKEYFQTEDLDQEEEGDDDHNFEGELTDLVGQLGLTLAVDKLVKVQKAVRENLAQFADETTSCKVIHQGAIQSLAELTSRLVELFHKTGQLLLLDNTRPFTVYKSKADLLHKITALLCRELSIVCSKFVERLNTTSAKSEEDDVTALVTNVYLEASNSSTYVQDAFELLLPVVQRCAVESYLAQVS